MKNIYLLIALSLFLFSTLNAHSQRAGDISFGVLAKTGGVQTPEKVFQANLGAGIFGQYYLNNFMSLSADIVYDYRFYYNLGALQYIEVPALVKFQLGNSFIGAGLKYSQSIQKPKFIISGNGTNLSYLSGVIEVSYQSPQSMFGNNIWINILTGFGGYKTALRLGYAFTPCSYNMMNEYGEMQKYKNNPFFLEAVLRYDLASLFGLRISSRR